MKTQIYIGILLIAAMVVILGSHVILMAQVESNGIPYETAEFRFETIFYTTLMLLVIGIVDTTIRHWRTR